MTDKQQANINIIFYSEQCPTCRNLFFILKNENLLQNFKLECIDGRVDKFKSFLTKVPTMILAGHSKYLICEEIFDWVKSIRFVKYNRMMSMGKDDAKMYNGFCSLEMGSISDSYTPTNDANSMALPQSFFGFGKEKANMIYTPPKEKPITKADQETMIANEESQRNKDSIVFAEIAKKGQVEAIINQKKHDLMQEMQG
jgi:hypothetical protein